MARFNLRGILLVVFSAVIFGFAPIAAKIAYANGGTPFQLLYARYFLIPVFFLYLRARRIPVRVTKKEGVLLLVLGILGSVITALTLLYAYVLLPSGTATALHFLYCVLITVGCAVFFKERLSLKCIGSAVACTAGVCLLLSPGGSGNIAGILVALISAVAYAAYSIILDKSGIHYMHPLKLSAYTGLVALLFLTLFAAATDSLHFSMNARGWFVTTVYYLILMQLGGLCYIRGIHYIGAQHAAILSTLEPLTSVVIGILAFQESFDLVSGLGIILIISGTFTVISANCREADRINR